MDSSTVSDGVRFALAAYGLEYADARPLAGGHVNTAYLISSARGRFVLKEFSGFPMTSARLEFLYRAQSLATQRGLPVPRLRMSLAGQPFAEAGGVLFILSEFAPGHVYEDGGMPHEVALRMGTTLAKLHQVLAELPDGEPWVVPGPAALETNVATLLTLISERRSADPLAALCREILEKKLQAAGSLPTLPPTEPCQWLHGDYTWRNVIFGNDNEIAAVIDFDNMKFMPRAYDVMRSFTFSFPDPSSAADSFFAGYAREAGLTPDQAVTYVSHWRHVSTHRLWPLDTRYLEPDRYNPAWDPALASLLPPSHEHWERLTDRLSGLLRGKR